MNAQPIPTDLNTPSPAEAPPPGCTWVGDRLYMTDTKGRLVPRSSVKAIDLLQDETVRKIMAFAEDLSAQVARFRQHTLQDIGDLIGLLAQEYGVVRGGVKGNITLMTVDGLMKVDLAVADRIVFGPELQQAKALVDECLMEWSADSNAALQTIVQSAFNVDRQGYVSPAALFSLLRHDIADPRWKRAMDAIRDSIRPVGTKEYVRFYRRGGPSEAWQAVTINVAVA